MKPGYENHDQRRPVIAPAATETRSGTVAGRRASWAGQGKPDRGTPRQTGSTSVLSAEAQAELLQLRARLAGLGA